MHLCCAVYEVLKQTKLLLIIYRWVLTSAAANQYGKCCVICA